jgi:hypothetical protein
LFPTGSDIIAEKRGKFRFLALGLRRNLQICFPGPKLTALLVAGLGLFGLAVSLVSCCVEVLKEFYER